MIDIWRVNHSTTKSYTSPAWSQNSPMILCCLDYWLISNSLQDSVKVTSIIPAIKTDHAATSLEFNISSEHIKGPGYWKMNCSLLDDDNYIREVTAKLPVWMAESRSGLSDNRSIWDWIKFNIRTHAVQHSKRKARERKEKENILQKEFTVAKQKFESDPTDENAVNFNSAKDKLELFYEKNSKGSLFTHGLVGVNMVKRASNIFLI